MTTNQPLIVLTLVVLGVAALFVSTAVHIAGVRFRFAIAERLGRSYRIVKLVDAFVNCSQTGEAFDVTIADNDDKSLVIYASNASSTNYPDIEFYCTDDYAVLVTAVNRYTNRQQRFIFIPGADALHEVT